MVHSSFILFHFHLLFLCLLDKRESVASHDQAFTFVFYSAALELRVGCGSAEVGKFVQLCGPEVSKMHRAPRTAPHQAPCTAPHRTALHRTALHRTTARTSWGSEKSRVKPSSTGTPAKNCMARTYEQASAHACARASTHAQLALHTWTHACRHTGTHHAHARKKACTHAHTHVCTQARAHEEKHMHRKESPPHHR